METQMIKIPAKGNSALNLKVLPGHFATSHSHINNYVDITGIKSRLSEAKMAADMLAQRYTSNTLVDTIVCMDGTDVIGTLMAQRLTEQGIMSVNRHNTINIITPEIHTNGQIIFRDNLQHMIENKHVILLIASATTGITISRSINCITYYGGILEGVSALYSATEEVAGHTVDSIFHVDDIFDYHSYDPLECPFCQAGQKLDAIINGYGYSKL